jgi:hypothetical protein
MSSLGGTGEQSMDLDDTFADGLAPQFADGGIGGSALDSSDEDADGEDDEDMEETAAMTDVSLLSYASSVLHNK